MKLWILDDRKFPTGYANGGFERNPEHEKIYIAERHMDIMGPCKDGAVLVENFFAAGWKAVRNFGVSKARHTDIKCKC